ncbi:MAG: PQQ-dependent sugar dehydrogenase [Candidatus Kapabacteria bacterium]|nr:PQQ-dependent sugar dehydrogenase [Candidatus Kapabacteria bacterium]
MKLHTLSVLTLIIVSSVLTLAQPRIGLAPFAKAGIGVTSNVLPVDIAHCGDYRLFVVRKQGTIEVINPDGTLQQTPFLNIVDRVLSSGGEQGLLGLAFHPDFKTNGYFYVNYTRKPDGATRISRFRAVSVLAQSVQASTEDTLMLIPQDFTNHNGGCLRFGKDGFLYIGMGDGGSGNDPNNRSLNNLSLLGKMLRIDVNSTTGQKKYGIPPSNPFVSNSGYAPEIWATGLRNPWKFNFDMLTGDMWIGDVGQDKWEEVSFQLASSKGGENYGWSCYEGNEVRIANRCGAVAVHTKPIYVYPHAAGFGESITGGDVYRGSMFPQLRGNYIFVDFEYGTFFRTLKVDTGFVTTRFRPENPRANTYGTLGIDYAGEMYAASIGNGTITRFVDSTCLGTTAEITLTDSTIRTNATPIALSATPVGGEFFGYGVTGSTFNPAGLDTGLYFIEYRATTSNGCGARAFKRLRVLPAIVSVDEDPQSLSSRFSIASGVVGATLNILASKPSAYSVYSTLGEQVMSGSYEAGYTIINIQELTNGSYIITNGLSSHQFVVLR